MIAEAKHLAGVAEDFNENLELELLFEAINSKYGFDFRNYSNYLLKKQVLHYVAQIGCANISELTHRLIYEPNLFPQFFQRLSINTTEMFRDPDFYHALRDKVLPLLAEEEIIKIWHAGCSTGEEVYSLAILLRESGITQKTLVYATDFNHVVLEKARAGIYPVHRIKQYTRNYQAAGGEAPFSQYYTAHYNFAQFNPELRQNIIFANHNLATEDTFAEVNLILCRNVLIYFNPFLQNRALSLFRSSLPPAGILCLGKSETLRFTEISEDFDELVPEQKIYRKKYS